LEIMVKLKRPGGQYSTYGKDQPAQKPQ